MSDGKQSFVRILIREMTAPIILCTILAVSLFLELFLAIAGLLAGACVILVIVRWANQRDNPLAEIGEMMLREEAPDLAWMEGLRRKHREACERELRIWRKNAW